MAYDTPWLFYVVLTNISNEPQTVWEDGNSWGDQVISFRVVAGAGTKAVIPKRAGFFGKDTPQAFVVRPGEHKVYEVRLARGWTSSPLLPKVNEIDVKLTALKFRLLQKPHD
jgi:hypothetical protein